MTTLATIFLVIAILCAIASIYFSVKAFRRLNNATQLLDLMFQQDTNYLNWKKSKEQSK